MKERNKHPIKAEWIVFSIVLLVIIGAIIGIVYRRRKGKLGSYDILDDNGPGGITDLMDWSFHES